MCREVFAALCGIGKHPRLSSIYKAVKNGLRSCPIDTRYLKRGVGLCPRPVRGEISSYLHTLCESVAETMPEDDVGESYFDKGDDFSKMEIDEAEQSTITIVQSAGAGEASAIPDSRRFVPPGSMYDTWRQFLALGSKCGFRVFSEVWASEFPHLLFRSTRQHSVCPVCVKHKLLIRLFAHDMKARIKQRMLYERHLQGQHADRKWYWFLRAQSRLLQTTIVMIIDGMDQSKFCWPRAPFFTNHEFDGFVRPRLQITGVLAHGYFSMLTISHTDISKSGSTTVDLVAHILTELHQLGVSLSDAHMHCQLDNTASTNKNNTLLLFLAAMVAAGLICTFTANFLRVGHTHEDTDQFFGELAKWVKKRLHYAQCLAEFKVSLDSFLKHVHRPYEKQTRVRIVDQVRDWKHFLEGMQKKCLRNHGAHCASSVRNGKSLELP